MRIRNILFLDRVETEREEWFFSIVDVLGVLTDSPDYNTGRKYWNKLKQCLKEEGSEQVTNCHLLKCGTIAGADREHRGERKWEMNKDQQLRDS